MDRDQHIRDELGYLRERVDGIADTLSKNTTILQNNTDSLKEHIRRTEILEEQMETALLPIRVGRILVWILGIAGTIAGIYEAFWH